LFAEDGAPGVVSRGVAFVSQGHVVDGDEYLLRPHRTMTDGAYRVNGISEAQAQTHPLFVEPWPHILPWLDGQVTLFTMRLSTDP